MYWGESDIPGRYELIDGQQRTMSICRFVKDKYSIEYQNEQKTFTSLPHDLQENILDYPLEVYHCVGTESEKLAWFETINIAGNPLTRQELRNAVYTGAWLSSAKSYFSKSDCAALVIGKDYIKGIPNRQEILETVLKWAADAEGIKGNKKEDAISLYMAKHRKDVNADALWEYYKKVMDWAKSIFMADTDNKDKAQWGLIYNKYKDVVINNGKLVFYKRIEGKGEYPVSDLLSELNRLQDNESITSKAGIYDYVLSGDESKLSIRKFPDKIKKKVYKKQNGLCKLCGKPFAYEDMAGDHIQPWSKGGETVESNCQMLCVTCNSKKSNKEEKATDEIYCCNCGKPVKRGLFCQYCGTKN